MLVMNVLEKADFTRSCAPMVQEKEKSKIFQLPHSVTNNIDIRHGGTLMACSRADTHHIAFMVKKYLYCRCAGAFRVTSENVLFATTISDENCSRGCRCSHNYVNIANEFDQPQTEVFRSFCFIFGAFMLTAPTPLCPNPMQVHSIVQETPDVWTIGLLPEAGYSYKPGQYALVCIDDNPNMLRAYTISSSPGAGAFLTITVRRIESGVGSNWLTGKIKIGDYLWLSDAQGAFTCADAQDDKYLFLAGGCGVTPIMSMVRWLLINRPETNITVFYNMRTPGDMIFANEWEMLTTEFHDRLKVVVMAEEGARGDFEPGRLSLDILRQKVPDAAERTVMTCGPNVYMDLVEQWVRTLGVPPEKFHKEQFHVAAECILDDMEKVKLTVDHLRRDFSVVKGSSLLVALEQNGVSTVSSCRSGICGACRTRVLSGDYTTTSQQTLTQEEIDTGFVLACSCRIQSDIVVE